MAYQYRMRTNCSQAFVSDYSDIQTFEKPCLTPNFSFMATLTETTAVIAWGTTSAPNYFVQYRKQGDGGMIVRKVVKR